jgi:hypothetical protein
MITLAEPDLIATEHLKVEYIKVHSSHAAQRAGLPEDMWQGVITDTRLPDCQIVLMAVEHPDKKLVQKHINKALKKGFIDKTLS